MDKHIEERLAELLPELARRGIRISSQREIPYGLQLRLGKESSYGSINLYYSEKKGVSLVPSAPPDSPLKAELEELCGTEERHIGSMHSWNSWIGSDEGGKGDYFGALVVAGFAMESELAGPLEELGVRDSKRLKDTQIKKIAVELYSRHRERIVCVVINPPRYNEIIAEMQEQRKNLNDLLAWLHGQAIGQLLERWPQTQGVLVDQFSTQKKVAALLKKKGVQTPVEERTGAEADLAVAAASIVARYQFLQNREAMREAFGLEFPLGASRKVLAFAHEFADRFGMQRLPEVAKIHFITSRKLQQREIFSAQNRLP